MIDQVHDLDSPESIAAQEANMFAYWSTLAAGPQGELYNRPDQIRFSSGIASPFLNGVMNARLSPAQVDAAIEANRSYFAERAVPALWWVGPTTQPADLGQRLAAHGLSPAGQQPIMAIDLTTLPDESPPLDFTIAAVDDEATLRSWCDIISACFDMPKTGNDGFFEIEARLGVAANPARYRLIGYHNGVPVATACMVPGAGVGGIYTIAVLEQARQHGFGAAITLAVAHEARRQGYRVATLQATAMGRPVYRRLGFHEVATFDCYLYSGEQA
jgi:GNAT superfamily N-acetyltransferase